jgi:hypothetical protein
MTENGGCLGTKDFGDLGGDLGRVIRKVYEKIFGLDSYVHCLD